MKRYHRYEKDGSCTVICLQCFATLGIVREKAAAAALERSHICSARAHEAEPSRNALRSCNHRLLRWLEGMQRGQAALLVPISVLILYILPTLMELLLRPYSNPWFSIILFGDTLGCLCLALVFGRRRTAVLLYVGLTASEALIFSSGEAPRHVIAWVVDLVPTVIVAVKFARLSRRAPARSCPPTAM